MILTALECSTYIGTTTAENQRNHQDHIHPAWKSRMGRCRAYACQRAIGISAAAGILLVIIAGGQVGRVTRC